MKNTSFRSLLFSLSGVFVVYFLLAYSFSFWQIKSPQSIEKPWGIVCIFSSLAALILIKELCNKKVAELFNIYVFALGLLLFFFGDWTTRNYNFVGEQVTIRGEIILFTLALFLIPTKKFARLINTICALLALLICYSFFEASHGKLLFSDDHSVFFYRLELLKQHFPHIPVYNTFWSAGRDTLDLFATGVLNFYFINAPLIYAFELEKVYNITVAIVIFLLPFASSFFAARILKLPSPVPMLAGLLSITTSSLWYVWGLKYGTLGFIVSSALVPIVFAISSKIHSDKEECSLLEAIVLIIGFSLLLFWSPAGLVFIPAIALGIINFKKIYKKKYLLLICSTICLINLPWIYFIWSEWSVNSFLSSEKPSFQEMHEAPAEKPVQYKHKSSAVDLKKSLQILREKANRTNPLLFFLAIPGFFLLKKSSRKLYALSALWLLFLGTILVPLKPQLELDRMLIILSILCCIPTALSLNYLLETHSDSAPRKSLYALCFAFFIVAALATINITSNRTIDKFSFASKDFDQLVEFIEENKAAGRILFSGHVVHELDGGHLAPLTSLTKKPLLASSHAHEFWTYKQIFPGSFIKEGDAGVERYLDLHNASIVAAHEPHWRNWFRSRPEKYSFIKKIGRFVIFKRLEFDSNYFYAGEGRIIEQASDKLLLTVNTKNVILKFSYLPALTSSACDISNEKIAEEVNFIKLSNCPKNKLIEIRAKTFIERLSS